MVREANQFTALEDDASVTHLSVKQPASATATEEIELEEQYGEHYEVAHL